MSRDYPGGRNSALSRRAFLKAGGALAASGMILPLTGRPAEAARRVERPAKPTILRHRMLGRTGFSASDIGLGGSYFAESNVVRYAVERGINYIDTAPNYGNGDSESKIGQAMRHLDRSQLFITTKILLQPDEDAASIRERFARSLARMRTDYADALFMHDIRRADLVGHAGYHAAMAQLKAEGRVRFAGLSSHGPNEDAEDSMADVLLKAAEDGRFDLFLLRFSFLEAEEGGRVLAACREKNIGATAMKTLPGYMDVPDWNPADPYEGYTDYIERVGRQGVSREEAVQRIVGWIAQQRAVQARMRPFIEKHGIETDEQLREAAVQWALAQAGMHCVCLTLPSFEAVDRGVSFSGTELGDAGAEFLRDYAAAFGAAHCRIGCTDCMGACPHRTPVSRIMRYGYYFVTQRQEKRALRKYAALDRDASRCLACDAPCAGACPHGVAIQPAMVRAHEMLSLA
ncbi:MAG: aldo/keto reductase [Candidatus Krumholzibacteriota bacterium]|nr:aldo/keto reductase [Candidatus Krumholzibacteriota bacterium]